MLNTLYDSLLIPSAITVVSSSVCRTCNATELTETGVLLRINN